MFGKNSFFATKSSNSLSLIAHGAKLSGNLELSGDMLIGGEVSGKIISEGKIIIERTAKVTAEIKCREFIVNGYFKGRLICERLVIQNHGVVDGDVASTTMQIQEGGQFIGLSKPCPASTTEASLPPAREIEQANHDE